MRCKSANSPVSDHHWEESLEKWEISEALMVLKVEGAVDGDAGDAGDAVVIERAAMRVDGNAVAEREKYSLLQSCCLFIMYGVWRVK